eukprot:3747554-Pyramimonas_sp.AAC.1
MISPPPAVRVARALSSLPAPPRVRPAPQRRCSRFRRICLSNACGGSNFALWLLVSFSTPRAAHPAEEVLSLPSDLPEEDPMSPLGAPSVAAGDRRAVASGRIFDVDITVSATPGASWGRQVEPPAVSQLVLEAEAPRPETPGAAATRPHAA